jgi:single-strand DNA-binding protein
MRYTATGTATTSFRLAVNRRSRAQEGQEPREETDWFTVVTWQKLAEIASQHLAKGARVYVEGRLQTRSWEGQDGQKRYATEIIASDLIMLDTRQAAGVASGGGGAEQVEDIPVEGSDIPF